MPVVLFTVGHGALTAEEFTALLRQGPAPAALRYASVHPYDVELLERVGDIVPADDPLLPALTARLAVARTT